MAVDRRRCGRRLRREHSVARLVVVAVFFAVTFALGIVGFAWVNWSDATVPITTNPGPNPTRRAIGSLMLFAIVMSPLLLARALEREEEAVAVAPPQRRLANTTGGASASGTI